LRREHFFGLHPFCPTCKRRDGSEPPLRLSTIFREEGDHVLQGLIVCSAPACQREYPILDGIPILVPNLREYISTNIMPMQERWDIDPLLNSVISDCCGPGSPMDVTRQHLSNYCSDHYGDLDPDTPGESSVVRVLKHGLQLLGPLPDGTVLDIGCSVGRTSFELAQHTSGLVLGIDLNFAMVRVAAHALRHGRIRHPRRRVGIVYDHRDFPVEFAGAARVDFWLCDACFLPFPAASVSALTSLNVLDCLPHPHLHLQSISHLLDAGGRALLGCPYDWSIGATKVESWMGGHSQRGPDHGASEPLVRSLLTDGEREDSITGLEITAEDPNVPWQVRLHDRSQVEYQVHLMALKRGGDRD
jgi:SAM-dependent methyltransferase/uncharacterized protein YbaR (Trm112 family)